MTPEEAAQAAEAERAERTEKYYQRLAGWRPTPTQRENDLIRVGALDPNAALEPDGSEIETPRSSA
jgi:hypothetical protein